MHDYLVAGRRLLDSRVYNGFTWEERIAVNPVQRTRRRHDNPLVCSISGFSAPHDPKGSEWSPCRDLKGLGHGGDSD